MNAEPSDAPVQTSASVRIFGQGLDFENISRTLGVDSSETHITGEVTLCRTPLRTDVWILDSPLSHTLPLDSHLKWLRQALINGPEFRRSASIVGEMDSYCGVSIEGERCSFLLSPEALRLFTDLRVSMYLSLIFAGYSDLGGGSTLSQSDPRASIGRPRVETYHTTSEVRLEGDAEVVERISRKFGLATSATHGLGDREPPEADYAKAARSLRVPLPQNDKLDAHLNWLAVALRAHRNLVRSLKQNGETYVHCKFGTESDTGGVDISAEALDAFVEFSVPLCFDIFLI